MSYWTKEWQRVSPGDWSSLFVASLNLLSDAQESKLSTLTAQSQQRSSCSATASSSPIPIQRTSSL